MKQKAGWFVSPARPLKHRAWKHKLTRRRRPDKDVALAHKQAVREMLGI